MTVARREDLRDTDAYAGAVEDWSQAQVEQSLIDLAREASRIRIKLRRSALNMGRSKARYKATAARVALVFRDQDIEAGRSSRGVGAITESTREARINDDEAVRDSARHYYMAEAVQDSVVETARLIRAEMSALQSVLADLRPMVSER